MEKQSTANRADKAPLISVLVPVYNTQAFLPACVDSILNQTYSPLEVILVNDGSTDDSAALCDAYAARDSRVRVIHQGNGGLSAARNAGLDAARGDLLAFIDSDDTIHPEMMARLYQALSSSNAQMSVCNYALVDEKGAMDRQGVQAIRDEVLEGKANILHKLEEDGNWYWVVACTKLYRKELFRTLRFPLGKLHEDEFVIHHVLLGCDKVACISNALYYYFQRSDSITGSAYSLRRLDGAQAQFERAQTLLDNGMPPSSAYHACAVGLHVLANSYTRLDVKSPAYQQRYRQLLAQYRQAASRLMKEKLSFLLKARLWLNARSPYYTWKFLERFLRR